MNELLKSGTILNNTYRILRVIDQGGMGAVYMAENRQLFNETCAIKEMLDNFSSPTERKEGLQLFEQEATILHRLRHSNLPRVHAYFSENNRYYLAMDYIKGRTLENIVESTSDFIPESAVLRWCADLCNILEYLHAQKPPIIFRDMNPRNIMLEDGTGEIKLIDFGIARFFKAGKSADTVSLGSPGYSPIEQYGRGQTDVRSEVYTLGATLYHLLTRKVPVPAVERIKPTPVLLTPPRHINRRISPNTEQVILKALELNPDQRYQSISEMRQSLYPRQSTQKVATQTTGTRTAKPPTGAQQAPPQPKPQTQSKPQAPPQPKPQSRKQPTRPTTGSVQPDRRSPKLVWFVLLFVVSFAVSNWVEGWQDRNSGGDGTPVNAKTLAVPGTQTDRVSFLSGDRTDWWQMRIDRPCTLVVTLTPRVPTDGVRLTLFDRNGRSVLMKGATKDGRVQAVLPLDRPGQILAQVLASRIWDGANYTIQATNGDSGYAPLFASSNSDMAAMTVSESAENHLTPDTAPDLRPDSVIGGRIIAGEGQGVAWWRIRAPSTGLMAITVDAEAAVSPSVEVYTAEKQRISASQERRNSLSVAVMSGDRYFLKLIAGESAVSGAYSIRTRFEEDPDVFSGTDRMPNGSNKLPFEGDVQDTVSYVRGDRTDWWRVDFPASGRIGLKFQTDRSDEVLFQVYEASAVQQGKIDDESKAFMEIRGNKQVSIDGNAGTSYYVAVAASERSGFVAYAIHTLFTLDPEANSGPDAAPSGARALSIDGGVRGTVDYDRGDRTDWWRITAPGSGLLTLLLIGQKPDADLQIELYDAQGERLIEEARTYGSSREEISVTLAGRTTYLVKVYAESAGDASAYQLTTWYAMEPDANSGGDGLYTGAKELRIGKSSRGGVNYNAGDRTDWWKIRTPGAGTLIVILEGETFLANLDMKVYEKPDSASMASSQTPRSGREQVSLQVNRAGWYYVEVFAYGQGDESQYTLTATFIEQ